MKTALITGASRGIGEGIARAFSANGYNVIVNYNNSEKRAVEIAHQIGGVAIKADVANSREVKAMFDFAKKQFGGVDVLINNAGIALKQSVLQDVTEEDFDRIVSVNLKGVYNCCRCALEYMVENKKGSIINISSIWGQIGGACEVVYSMTKAGVIGFTKALAKELAPSGIRVNAVSPGFINTDMNAHLSIEEVKSFEEEIPLGRIGQVSEVAQVVLFLADEKRSGYITGEVVSVSGGIC